METGVLIPRTNNTVEQRRYTGAFGQPDGFGSVLDVTVKADGRLVLTLLYKATDNQEHMLSVELDDGQRNNLAAWIGRYQPRFVEVVEQNSEAYARMRQ